MLKAAQLQSAIMHFKQDVVDVVGALNAAEIRYLIVGGLAVASHGYLRTTKDIDLVVALGGYRRLDQAIRVMKRKEYPSDPWFYASFEGARIAALLKTCDLPFSEKLDFIDEAFRLFPKGFARRSASGLTPVVAETAE